MKKILITGGAGFIGTRVARKLLELDFEVVVLDSLSPQVHVAGEPSADFKRILPEIEFIKGDIVDPEAVNNSLRGIHGVVHLAAETGTGQSMYEISKYVRVNDSGTANLLEAINLHSSVESVVVASSRAVYGEGKYSCSKHGVNYPSERNDKDLSDGCFDFYCTKCGSKLIPIGTDEESPIKPRSIYGLTKFSQESMVLQFGRGTGIRTSALRYQNVYGPGQSLSNPYTGILAIFSSRLRCNKDLYIFEDGQMSRDFVYVDDVVEATINALLNSNCDQQVFNVGSGSAISVLSVAERLRDLINARVQVLTTGEYRFGDIRHNFSDNSKIEAILDFSVNVDFDQGLSKFLEWALEQQIETDNYEESLNTLRNKGLLVKA